MHSDESNDINTKSSTTFKTFIYNNFREDVVERLFKQRKMIEKNKKFEEFVWCWTGYFDKSVLRGKVMREVFQNGRHLYITCIVTAQYLMDLSPSIRSNTDICLSLAENVHANKEKLHKVFFGFFESYRDFNSVFTACTQNYEALVMDLTKHSNNIEDCVFWYKAPMPVPPFRIGNDIYFKLSSNNRSSKDDDESTILTKVSKPKRIRRVQKCDEYGNKVVLKTRTGYR